VQSSSQIFTTNKHPAVYRPDALPNGILPVKHLHQQSAEGYSLQYRWGSRITFSGLSGKRPHVRKTHASVPSFFSHRIADLFFSARTAGWATGRASSPGSRFVGGENLTGALHVLELQLSPVTTSIILRSDKIQNGDILLPANCEVHLEKFAVKMERERPDLECPTASTVDGDPLGQSSPSTPGECQSAAAEERLHRAAEHCHRPPTTNHYYTRHSTVTDHQRRTTTHGAAG